MMSEEMRSDWKGSREEAVSEREEINNITLKKKWP